MLRNPKSKTKNMPIYLVGLYSHKNNWYLTPWSSSDSHTLYIIPLNLSFAQLYAVYLCSMKTLLFNSCCCLPTYWVKYLEQLAFRSTWYTKPYAQKKELWNIFYILPENRALLACLSWALTKVETENFDFEQKATQYISTQLIILTDSWNRKCGVWNKSFWLEHIFVHFPGFWQLESLTGGGRTAV